MSRAWRWWNFVFLVSGCVGEVRLKHGSDEVQDARKPRSIDTVYCQTRVAYTWEEEFSSTNYPQIYPNNHEQCWRIESYQPDHRIVIEFEAFHLESHSSCIWDALEIYEGTQWNPRMTLLGTYCGNYIPDFISSHEEVITVYFRTDSSVRRSGFLGKYRASPATVESHSPASCVYWMSTDVYPRHIASPEYPGYYPNNQDVCWLIQTAREHHFIKFWFMTFDIEGHMPCVYDNVTIRDGADENSYLLATGCGVQPPPQPIYTTGNVARVRFRSDDSYIRQGFELEFQSIHQDDVFINVSAGTWWVILLILMALVVVVSVIGCILWRLKTQKKRMRSVDILAVDNTYYHTQIPSPSQTPLPPMPGASMHTATLPQGYYTSMDTGTGVPPPAQYFPPHYRAPSLADGMMLLAINRMVPEGTDRMVPEGTDRIPEAEITIVSSLSRKAPCEPLNQQHPENDP